MKTNRANNRFRKSKLAVVIVSVLLFISGSVFLLCYPGRWFVVSNAAVKLDGKPVKFVQMYKSTAGDYYLLTGVDSQTAGAAWWRTVPYLIDVPDHEADTAMGLRVVAIPGMLFTSSVIPTTKAFTELDIDDGLYPDIEDVNYPDGHTKWLVTRKSATFVSYVNTDVDVKW
jgi:hypothetical protein